MNRIYSGAELESAARWAGENSICAAVLKFGITDPTIRKTMIRLGIPRRRPGNLDTYSPALRMRAIQLRIKGTAPSKVEELTGIPARYVCEIVLKYRRSQRRLSKAG